MPYKFVPTTFAEVLPIWTSQLWPQRKSVIEPVSAIKLSGQIDMSLMKAEPYFWKAVAQGGLVVGVVSGFKTEQNLFRSRGLWVDEQYRRQGIGSGLLETICQQAVALDCKQVWTMPRVSSFAVYEKNGFSILNELDIYEFGPHYIAIKDVS